VEVRRVEVFLKGETRPVPRTEAVASDDVITDIVPFCHIDTSI